MHKSISILVILLFLLFMFPLTSIFANYVTDQTQYVSRNKTINDSVFLSGDRVTIEGTINGNVYAVAGTVVVNGHVNGNVYATGGNVEVGGYVRDSVVVAAKRVGLASSPSTPRGVIFAAQKIQTDL